MSTWRVLYRFLGTVSTRFGHRVRLTVRGFSTAGNASVLWHFPPRASERIAAMVKKSKINLAKVMASLNTLCVKCGYSIPPQEIRRVNFDQIECPKCKERFVAGGAGK